MVKVVIPVEDCARGLVSSHFGKANYYILYSIEAGEIKKVECIENPKHLSKRPGEYFAEMGVDAVLIPNSGGIGRKAISIFRARGIKVLMVNAVTAEEAIRKLMEGKVSELLGEGCHGKRR